MRNRIRYFGMSINPDRRFDQHKRNKLGGKERLKLKVEGPVVTRKTAKIWEYAKIRAYRLRNGPNSLLNKLPKR